MSEITGKVIPIRTLFSAHSESFFRAPVYQRPFVWDLEQVEQLVKDAMSVKDGRIQHFLGPIVRSEVKNTSTGEAEYLIVDGQQGLTTTILLALATISRDPKRADAKTLLDLVTFTGADGKRYLRWRPTNLDTVQLDEVLKRFRKDTKHQIFLTGGEPSGEPDRELLRAFNDLLAITHKMGPKACFATANSLLDNCVVAVITVPKGTDATQIFQSINATRKQLKTSDLIRNLVFQKFNSEAEADAFYAEEWETFENPLKKSDLFEEFLLTYAVQDTPEVTKAGLYRELSRRWAKTTPSGIVAELAKYRDIFLALAGERDLPWHGKSADLDEAMLRIARVDGAKNAWPYLLELLYEDQNGTPASRRRVAACIRSVESLMVRRGLGGIQNTGIRYFFTGLYGQKSVKDNNTRLRELIREERAGEMKGPSNKDIREFFMSSDVYVKRMQKAALYVLETHERYATPKDRYTYDELKKLRLTVDHIMPQTRRGGWNISAETHAELVNKVGNLILLKYASNSSKGCSSWREARQLYDQEKELVRPRRLASAKENRHWGPKQIKRRSEVLARFVASTSGWPAFD